MTLITNGESAEVIANRINKITVSATTNPTVNDDGTENYFVGSKWLNTTTGIEYTCTDNTTGAAVWIRVAPEVATQAEAEAGTNNEKAMSPLRAFQAIKKWIESQSVGSLGSLDNSTIAAIDSVRTALGKLQGQINATNTSLGDTDDEVLTIKGDISGINSSLSSINSTLGTLTNTVNAKQKYIGYGLGVPAGGSNGDAYDQYFN